MKMRSKYINKVFELMSRMRFMGWGCFVFFIISFLHFFITSCSSELEGPEEAKGVFLRVMGYTNEYVEVDAVTRATVNWQPAGYKESHVYVSYGIFFTKSDGSVVYNKFRYGADEKWYMVEEVTAGDNYYLYGYMPYDAGNVTIAPPSGHTYAEGAVMTFTNLNAVMTQDLCIVTAAKDATRAEKPEEPGKYTYTLGNGMDWLPPGDFKCKIKGGEGDENKNTLFFLYEHLYAALRLCFRVDDTYNQLRDICIKRLELESYQDEACTTLMPKLKADVTLTKLENNETAASPIVGDVVFQEDNSAGKMEKILIINNPEAKWTNEADRLPSLDENNKVYLVDTCYIPKTDLENFYKLTTTYDVYDRKGNLIRKDQSAVNVLNPKELFNQPQLLRGYMYTLRLTIAPTFLYMMSDDDLEFKMDIGN